MRTVVAALVVLVVAAACAGPVESETTQPPGSLRPGEFAVPTISPPDGSALEACPAALMTGVLVEDPAGGLGLEGDGGFSRVRWPYGWRGTAGPPVALVDADGAVIATVGQRVEVGGGAVGAGWWLGCGGVRVADG